MRGVVTQELEGRIHSGEVELVIEPGEGDELEFCNKLSDRSIPSELIGSVEKAVISSAPGGIDLGYPNIKSRVTLTHLEYLEGETTELGLAMAVSSCIQKVRFRESNRNLPAYYECFNYCAK